MRKETVWAVLENAGRLEQAGGLEQTVELEPECYQSPEAIPQGNCHKGNTRMKMTEISSEGENMWLQVKSEVIRSCTENGCVDLAKAASVVKNNSGILIPLVKPKSYHLRVCGQDDTVYAGNEDQLDAWEDHYLPERMAMEVVGAIDDFPCEAYDRQLVLLLCEDGNIYAYEDEVLHLVARSLRDLFESGMTFPGIESFNLGECFEDYTEEEYNEMMECSEIKEMREKYNKFQEYLELELLALLQQFKCSQFKEELQMRSDIEVVENVKTSETTCSDIVDVLTKKDVLGVYMDEMLHSIFFLGYIYKAHLTPKNFFPKDIVLQNVKSMFPEPFKKYNSHLPTRTPFSILLNMMEILYSTEEKIKEKLLDLLEKMKFPNPLHKPGRKELRRKF
ncbi:hypothetical protein AOLI_G00319770 [Acnodon oligacanthus]